VRLNRRLLPVLGAVAGSSCSFRDRHAPRRAARYWLQDVDPSGARTWHGRFACERRERRLGGQEHAARVLRSHDAEVAAVERCQLAFAEPFRDCDISLGRGVTIHREDCPNVKALMRNPERFTAVEWDGRRSSAT
jgi:hypothetical protein